MILLMRNYSQILSPVIETVQIDMVNFHPFDIPHNKVVQIMPIGIYHREETIIIP